MKFFQRRNNFTSYSDNQDLKKKRGYETIYLPAKGEREKVAEMWARDLKPPYTYVKHINFLGSDCIDVIDRNITPFNIFLLF